MQVLFRRKLVVKLDELRRVLRTTSRTTVFRVLAKVGYFTSYSHAGRYYTLRHIPKFDGNGLWFCGEVRFSVHKTLRATIVPLVCKAPAGYTHDELALILGLRVHDTLRSLVRARQLEREHIDTVYVYFDADSNRRNAQREQRWRSTTAVLTARPPPPLNLLQIVEVLLAVIKTRTVEAVVIGARLRACGIDVSNEQVQTIFEHYGLEKKTAHSRSPRLRRSGTTSQR
jgi:hypothetical protein